MFHPLYYDQDILEEIHNVVPTSEPLRVPTNEPSSDDIDLLTRYVRQVVFPNDNTILKTWPAENPTLSYIDRYLRKDFKRFLDSVDIIIAPDQVLHSLSKLQVISVFSIITR